VTRIVGVDTETHLIAPGRLAPKLVCVTLYDGDTRQIYTREQGLEPMRALLSDPTVGLVAHNAVFDFLVLHRAYPSLRPLIWGAFANDRVCCTLVAEKLRRIAAGTLRFCPKIKRAPMFRLSDLVFYHLGERVTGKTGDDVWRLRFAELDGLEVSKWPREARDYAIEDAVYVWRVFHKIAAYPGFPLPTFGDQMRAAWALGLMAAWGLRTDPVEVAKLENKLRENVSKWVPRLQEAGLLRANGTKNDGAIRSRVLDVLGSDCPRTPKGKPSSANATLLASGDDALTSLAALNREQKLLTGFVPILWQATEHPFSPRWNVLVASGRTSCGAKDNPGNLQNQPREGGVRRCWVPREGWVYAAADYAVAELAALAEVLLTLYGKSAMADALIAGRKLHLHTGAAILGWSYERMVATYADKTHPDHAQAKRGRQFAKIANFGLGGGLGVSAFSAYARASGIDLTIEQANKIKGVWLSLYPEMRRYFAQVSLTVSYADVAVSHPITGFVRGDLSYCVLANHYFQHLVSAGAKRALWQVAREAYGIEPSALTGTRPVSFVHDEIIIEVRESEASDAAKRLSSVMVAAMQTVIQRVPITAEAALMRRWYKDAQPVYDQNGGLMPWQPTNG